MNKFKSVLWGVLIIIVGIIIALDSFNIINVNLFFKGWWTLFIIIPSLIGFITDVDKKGNLISLIIGVLLFLGCNSLINFSTILKLIIPIILVIIGLSIIFKDKASNKFNEEVKKINKNSNNEWCSTFSSQEANYDNLVFEGGKATAVFGSVILNLANAKIENNQVIDVCCIFGGIDIIVPKNVKVMVKSNSIFGGVDNKVKTGAIAENDKVLYINASCIFGGVDIK